MYPALSNEPSVLTRGTSKKAQCPIQKTPSKHEITETLRPSSKSSNVQLSCKPTNIVKQDNAICNNVTSDEKLKTPSRTRFVSSSSSLDKLSGLDKPSSLDKPS